MAMLFRWVRAVALLVFLLAFVSTWAEGRLSTVYLLGVLVFGTDLYRDLRRRPAPAVFLYATSLGLFLVVAARSGHWLMGVAIFAIFGAIRTATWYWRGHRSPHSS